MNLLLCRLLTLGAIPRSFRETSICMLAVMCGPCLAPMNLPSPKCSGITQEHQYGLCLLEG